MPTLRKPSPGAVRAFLAGQESLALTYPEVRATATGPPVGYVVDHTRAEIGAGEDTFRAATAALTHWAQFDLGWVEAAPLNSPLAVGVVVGVLARAMGFWWLNACRIVDTVNEMSEAGGRFGFAYGTLPGHAAVGEERFLVEWDRASDAVSYDILAFSRPKHALARLGYPLARRTQKRFGRDSVAAMRRAVTAG